MFYGILRRTVKSLVVVMLLAFFFQNPAEAGMHYRKGLWKRSAPNLSPAIGGDDILLPIGDKIQFDANTEHVSSLDAGHLDLTANISIDLNAPTLSIDSRYLRKDQSDNNSTYKLILGNLDVNGATRVSNELSLCTDSYTKTVLSIYKNQYSPVTFESKSGTSGDVHGYSMYYHAGDGYNIGAGGAGGDNIYKAGNARGSGNNDGGSNRWEAGTATGSGKDGTNKFMQGDVEIYDGNLIIYDQEFAFVKDDEWYGAFIPTKPFTDRFITYFGGDGTASNVKGVSLEYYAGEGYGLGTGGPGGDIYYMGGSARGTGNNKGGDIGFGGGNPTGSGDPGKVIFFSDVEIAGLFMSPSVNLVMGNQWNNDTGDFTMLEKDPVNLTRFIRFSLADKVIDLANDVNLDNNIIINVGYDVNDTINLKGTTKVLSPYTYFGASQEAYIYATNGIGYYIAEIHAKDGIETALHRGVDLTFKAGDGLTTGVGCAGGIFYLKSGDAKGTGDNSSGDIRLIVGDPTGIGDTGEVAISAKTNTNKVNFRMGNTSNTCGSFIMQKGRIAGDPYLIYFNENTNTLDLANDVSLDTNATINLGYDSNDTIYLRGLVNYLGTSIDNRYLRKDQDDNNSTYRLSLGNLTVDTNLINTDAVNDVVGIGTGAETGKKLKVHDGNMAGQGTVAYVDGGGYSGNQRTAILQFINNNTGTADGWTEGNIGIIGTTGASAYGHTNVGAVFETNRGSYANYGVISRVIPDPGDMGKAIALGLFGHYAEVDTGTNITNTGYGFRANMGGSGTNYTFHGTGGNIYNEGNCNITGAYQIDGNDRIDGDGFFRPVSFADGSAPNNSIYYSITQSKLVYKDSGGGVNMLY